MAEAVVLTADQQVSLLTDALLLLTDAGEELQRPLAPMVSMPRPRLMPISADVTWPRLHAGEIDWTAFSNGVSFGDRRAARRVALLVVQNARGRPRTVLAFLRRIQAASDWCLARRDGRLRAARTLASQQDRHSRLLQAEVVAAVLRR